LREEQYQILVQCIPDLLRCPSLHYIQSRNEYFCSDASGHRLNYYSDHLLYTYLNNYQYGALKQFCYTLSVCVCELICVFTGGSRNHKNSTENQGLPVTDSVEQMMGDWAA